MGQFGFGQSVLRREDDRLITGHGQYVDDMNMDGQAYAVTVRSPHAHAIITDVDTEEARAVDGVLGVYTGRDLVEDDIGTIPVGGKIENVDGTPLWEPPHPVLAADRVRFVGDAVAFVVAESLDAAKEAAELVMIDYETLPACAGIEAALADGAEQIWEKAPGNIAFNWAIGDEKATAEAIDKADHVTVLRLRHNRVVANPIEPRAALGVYDGDTESFTLYTNTQGSASKRVSLAEKIFKIDKEKIRVITPDVGGGFGVKGFLYAEQALVLYAARKLKRPVKWNGERPDCFQSDNHGRDVISDIELALDRDGHIRALRVRNKANLGAYISSFGAFITTWSMSRILGGLYRIPNMYAEVKGVYTNSVPVDAYRGAGRPESIYITERVIDKAARELGIGQDEIRRRNLIERDELPYKHPFVFTYDSGDFIANLDDALEKADWAGFEDRRADSHRKGKRRGIGISYYVESTVGAPEEWSNIKFNKDGVIDITVGTQSNGQGHETTFAQYAAGLLGVDPSSVRILQGDTANQDMGGGTAGSRSLHLQGEAIGVAVDKIIEKGTKLASHLLEAAPEDIEFSEGSFTIAGTDRAVTLMELADAARDSDKVPDVLAQELENGLDDSGHYERVAPTFPNGCHIAEVEIDPDTGLVKVVGYTVVDDFGRILNPMIVEGQVHGGIAQGIGQALMEECFYDEDGQLVTGSFMDYAMPKADDIPELSFDYNEIACTTNSLGIKGCGEAGTVGAMPAVMNAIHDALAADGVVDLDAPATPMRVWQAIHESGKAAA